MISQNFLFHKILKALDFEHLFTFPNKSNLFAIPTQQKDGANVLEDDGKSELRRKKKKGKMNGDFLFLRYCIF